MANVPLISVVALTRLISNMHHIKLTKKDKMEINNPFKKNKKIKSNIGWQNGNGSLTVTSGNTTGVFAHNLGVTPSIAIATPNGNLGGLSYWVTRNDTQVIVNLSDKPSSDITFDVITFM